MTSKGIRPPGRERREVLGDSPTSIITVPGASAYELWLNQGNVGTIADFMASLVGPQGPTGSTGAPGPDNVLVGSAVPAFASPADDGAGLIWSAGGWAKSATPLVIDTDPRLSDARTPMGAAGGDLAGTYPNPTIDAAYSSPKDVTLAPAVAGRNTVQPTVATPALILRAAAIGSANVQEWQNSTGTLVLSVDNSGNVLMGNPTAFKGRYLYDRGGTRPYVDVELGSASIGAVARSAGQTPWVARMAAGQTADAFQVQDSTGAAQQRLDAFGSFGTQVVAAANAAWWHRVVGDTGRRLQILGDGRLGFGLGTYTGATYDTEVARSGLGTLQLQGVSPASSSTLVVKQMAAQAADSFQTQDSTGAVLARVDSGGLVRTSSYFRSDSAGTAFRQYGPATPYVELSTNNIWLGDGTNAADVRILRNGAGVLQVQGQGAATASMFVVKAIAAQAIGSNLLQLVDSNGATLARFDSDGTLMLLGNGRAVAGLNTPAAQVLGSGSGISSTQLAVRANGNNVGIAVQPSAGGNGDLQQWQSSTGSVLARFDSAGKLGIGQAPGSALDVVGVMRAANSGTTFPAPASGVGFESGYKSDASYNATSGQVGGASLFQSYDRSGAAWKDVLLRGLNFGFDAGGSNRVAIRYGSGNPAMQVFGVVGQTGDLTQWLDSTGAAVARVGPAGDLTLLNGGSTSQIQLTTPGGRPALRTGNPANASVEVPTPGTVALRQLSGAGNIVEVRNAADTVLANFNAAGQLGLSNSVAPATPVAGGILYSIGGALHWKGSAGTDTQIAAA